MSEKKTKKFGIVIDGSRCIDCRACMIACKVENKLPAGYWRNWIRSVWSVDNSGFNEFQPGQCMQCDDPSCVAACPVGATYKLPDGIVAIDPKTCIGCANCVSACPYGARYRDSTRRIADKCDFCYHRLNRGEEPACVVTCPTRARLFGDLNDPDSEIRQKINHGAIVQIISSQVNTRPNIYYLEGTRLLDWAVTPTLPGNVHMPRTFWRTR